MDITHLKGLADEEENFLQELEQAQKKSLLKLGELQAVQRPCEEKLSKKIENKTIEFIADFKEYFEKEGFSVKETGEDIITAEYKTVSIQLLGIDYTGEYMCIRNVAGGGVKFKIDSVPTATNYRMYKKNLNIGQIRQIDFVNQFGAAPIDNEQFVRALTSVEELEKLNALIEENIQYYNEGVHALDGIDICIVEHDSDSTFKDFQEFIAAIDLN